jgi:hypothetical protein
MAAVKPKSAIAKSETNPAKVNHTPAVSKPSKRMISGIVTTVPNRPHAC